MYRLIYISTATKGLTKAEIENLLENSRKNNSKADITGMLIYRDGNFIQLLEGEENAVKELFITIQKDSRHRDCTVLNEAHVDKRCLFEWSMRYKSFDGKALFTKDEIDSDETHSLGLLSNFAFNMR